MAQIPVEPTKLLNSFGNSANVRDIPDNTPVGTNQLSINGLFPPITSIPIEAGGIPPDRTDFNAAFKLLGDNQFFLQNGGNYSYSNTLNYIIGSQVLYNNKIYYCIKENGPDSENGVHNCEDFEYWNENITNAGGVINGDLATNGQYFAIKTDFAKGTTPDTNKYYQLSVADNSGDYNAEHRFGCYTTIVKNNGDVETNIYALKNAANQSTGTAMGITVKSDGTQMWHCPSICEQKERRADVNNSIVRIYGGVTNPTTVWNQSAIELCGWENSSYPGWVVIHSGNGTTGRALTLKPDGNLIWNGNKLYLSSHFLLEETSNNITLGYPYGDAIGGLIAFRSTTDSQNPGGFSIYAKTSAGQKVLVGKYEPDSLSWNGKEIERVDSSGTRWIRFVSGLQICWGYVECNPTIQLSGKYYKRSTITYPVAFKSTPECMLTPYDSSTTDTQNPWCSCMIEHPSATSCGAIVWSMTTSPSGTTIKVSYTAIGYWK